MRRAAIALALTALSAAVAAQPPADLELSPMPAELITPQSMAYIPGGIFAMGHVGSPDAAPVHEVELGAFYMDLREVSNAEYKTFCDATSHRLPEFWGLDRYHCGDGYPDYPVVGVSRRDAEDYAKWAGKRLPTEAEWECAARGGNLGWAYPNGEDLADHEAAFGRRGTTRPVGSFDPNGYGLYEMAGNVWEWVSDFYDPDYYTRSPRVDPGGPEDGILGVVRGGSWHSGPGCLRVDARQPLSPGWVDFAVGFRCARDLVPED